MNGFGRKGDDFEALALDLERAFRGAGQGLGDDDVFTRWAARVFAFQYAENETYRRFCEARGVGPETLDGWWRIPPVPATAFKHLEIRSGTFRPEAVFRTSGTTAGPRTRGRHFVPKLALYRAAALGPFREHLMAGLERAPFFSLIPSWAEAPDSSLSFMIDAVAESLASSRHVLVQPSGQLEVDTLRALADGASTRGEPIVVVGTALAFAHLIEVLEGERLPPLPEGSRVMETGGFKGSGRRVTPDALYAGLSRTLGIASSSIVNEYGMTELLSQLYEPVLSEGVGARGVHVPPPWMRVQALDPETLRPVEPGLRGLLSFLDLANLGSVCHVLTQDVGSVLDGRVHLQGRLPGAEPRGCSRAMDELLGAARRS